MAYLGEEIPKLGFGLMRLPKIGDMIDVEQYKKMVDAFFEAGFNYFDTAWVYGGSEEATKKALCDRYPRDKYLLATKNASWAVKSREEAEGQLRDSLERTGAGYFDFYLLHNLGPNRTQVFEDYDMWNFAFEMKKKGLVKHVGFSFHSTPEELEEILNKHPETEFVQLQINYADWNDRNIRARECYETVRRHGLPVIIMEPVKGGMLANPPQVAKDIFDAADPDASYASWALRYAASLDGVITVLSGMSSLEQMQDNLKTMKGFTKLTEEQQKVVSEAHEAFKLLPLIQCTSCNYCAKVCPMEIGISGIFTTKNFLTTYNNEEAAKHRLFWDVENIGKKMAGDCIKCGACEGVCPQKLPIRDLLEECRETFGK